MASAATAAAGAAGSFHPPPRRLSEANPKFSIRPLGHPLGLPAGFEEATWRRLHAVIQSVFKQDELPGGLSQEEVYRLVEAMCVNGMSSSLFQRLHGESEGCVQELLAQLAGDAQMHDSGLSEQHQFLSRTCQTWTTYCSAIQQLCRLFMHLDRAHIMTQSCARGERPQSLHTCGIKLFRSALASQGDVQERVVQGMLGLIDEDRRGAPSSWLLLSSLAAMLTKLELYKEVFEVRLLDTTANFFRAESSYLVERLPIAEYLLHCDRRLNEERARCSKALEAETATGLLTAIHTALLKSHAKRILDSGFGVLVDNNQVDDLARLYRLMEEVEESLAVRKAWVHSIKRIGTSIMADAEVPEKSKGVMPALMNLQAQLQEQLASAFGSARSFAIALKDAFEDFLNKGLQNIPAKLLARHVDEVLRNEKACADKEMEQSLERVLGIFRYISTKDAFEAFFKKDLAKRLLQQRSSSDYAEASILQKLRDECGHSYTSKIEGMVKDIELSKATLGSFSSQASTQAVLAESGLEFDSAALTSGLWPTQPPSPDIVYPPIASRLQEMYAAFYSAQHSGKSLKWVPLLGQCTLRATFEGDVRKEFVVSHFQAITLLLFNGADKLTCAEIERATRIPKADLHRTLQSVSLHKTVKLLLKASKAREVDDAEVFTFNGSFTHKLYRITLSQITAKEQQEEEAGVEQRLFEDRQHEVDAAIVRIMKASKKLSHQELVTKVFATLSFPAAAADVKRRIESLIDREYLERNAQHASYTYLA